MVTEDPRLVMGKFQQYLKKIGLSQDGKKEVLLTRLVDHYEGKNKPVVVGVESAETSRLPVEVESADTSDSANELKELDTATGDAAGAKTKKKNWTVTDPTPSFYHSDLFRANFPLVQVHKIARTMPLPVPDKFEGSKLDPDMVTRAMRLWASKVARDSLFVRPPTTEKQSLPHQLALLLGMAPFSLPSPQTVELVNSIKQQKRKRDDLDELDWKSLLDDGHECSGFDVETSAVEKIQAVDHGDIPTVVLHVYDFRPVKRMKQTGDEGRNVNPDRVAAVLECKFADDCSRDRALFEGAYHASKYALDNLKNGHGAPIYVIAVTKSSWSYAKLVPEAYAMVRQGQIHPGSMEAFAGHQQMTGLVESDLQSLQQRMAVGTEYYRQNFRDNPQANYRDGPILVGHLYVKDSWFDLPNVATGGFNSDGSRRLFEGLMRLVVGDSVLHMTEAELNKRVRMNEAILAMVGKACANSGMIS